MPIALRPYVLATPRVQRALGVAEPGGAGAAFASALVLDPMRVASSALVDGIQRLDAALFAPRGMGMPRWALYDCAGLPGAVIGLGAEAAILPAEARAALALDPAFEGFAPVSMMIVIPMIGEGRWLAYTLGSIGRAAGLADLDARTLSLGLDAVRAASGEGAEVMAIAQWTSPEMAALSTLAPVRVLSAWLPAHDHAATAVLRLDLARSRRPIPVDAPGVTLGSIDLEDARALRGLQRDIEAGREVHITGSPCFQGPSQRMPIATSVLDAPAIARDDAPAPRDRAAIEPAPHVTTGVHPANERLLRDLAPFVVATPEHQARLELAPFGIAIPAIGRIDPLRASSARFLGLLSKLDALTFGPEGMPMPRWLFLDGSALPGGIVGLARPASALDPEARALFGLPDDDEGLVPLAMYIAVPTLDRGVWVGHNLASAAERLPRRGLEGLGRLTKALGLAVYGARAQIGATQWASRALHVHARLGPLELLSAWTPAHADIETLTYRAAIDDTTLHHLAGDPAGHVDHPPPDLWIDSADPLAMQSLQARIEAGERFQIVGPPVHLEGHHQRLPVHALPRARS